MSNAIISTIALTCIPKISKRHALEIYKHLDHNVEELFANSKEILKSKYPDISTTLLTALLAGKDIAMEKAKKEWEFILKHHIAVLCYGSPEYPQRLMECDDAPIILYYKGNANLNCTYSLSMVGTRKCTEYGKDMCMSITKSISKLRPETLIVSGLAYGIDILCHRGALTSGMNTIGVLAHGLDRIYPASHRNDAKQMVQQGGLLTEYMSGTTPEKGNFLSRNRIVAGLSDGCIVVESATKGGSLVTARIAMEYHRDVMAVPGRINDPYSGGCNYLIRNNTATLITNAEDVLSTLNWPSFQDEKIAKSQPVEQDLFSDLTEEEQLIANLLVNSEGKQINQLVIESNIPVYRISAILFELEMKGKVRLMAGGRYHLIK